jgi:hypothetical protein
MAIEDDATWTAGMRPKIPLADDVGLSRMQSCLDGTPFDAEERPVHIES